MFTTTKTQLLFLPAYKEAKSFYTDIIENLENFHAFPCEYLENLQINLSCLTQYQTITLLTATQDALDTSFTELAELGENGGCVTVGTIDNDGMFDTDTWCSDEYETEQKKQDTLLTIKTLLVKNITIL